MSWPQWQPPAQPTMPMMNAPMPMGIQYTAEQWQQMQQQNWQQWAQWQQQYQQWHQQYGAEYQKSLSAMANMGTSMSTPTPLMNSSVPPPLPNDVKPPPPPEEPTQPTPNTQPPPSHPILNKTPNQNSTTPKGFGLNSTSENNGNTTSNSSSWAQQSSTTLNQTTSRQNDYQARHQGKRQALEHCNDLALKKNKLDWQPPPSLGPTGLGSGKSLSTSQPEAKQFGSQVSSTHPQQSQVSQENKEDLSDPEKKFMKQFAEWEAQFNKWKEQNQDHPDKTQYREYEKKWEAWRNQLLERRELMRKKRLGLVPANASVNTSLDIKNNLTSTNLNPGVNKSSPDKNQTNAPGDLINPINSNSLEALFKNNLNNGIPGLDLVDVPEKPDEDIPSEKTVPSQGAPADGVVKGLNIEALSKNLNSILGDQKLLSMLSLVAQSTNSAPTTKSDDAPPAVQTQNVTPSGITLAPAKLLPDDQTSNWSTNTNNSGNSTPWNQDFNNRSFDNSGLPLNRSMDQKFEQSPNNRFNSNQSNHSSQSKNYGVNDSVPHGNYAYSQDGNSQSGSLDSRSNPNFSSKDRDMDRNQYHDYDRNEDKFNVKHQHNSFDDSYWSPLDGRSSVRGRESLEPAGNDMRDIPGDLAPAPPTITSFDELLQIDKIVDYDHKTLKQDTTDVRVFTPRLFDYRHKIVTRIPIPERPKWLSETFHNIPEFDPPISRSVPQYSRHAPERFQSQGMSGPSSGSYYGNETTFSRRIPPLMSANIPNPSKDFDKSNRFDDEFNYKKRNSPNKDDFERFKNQKWVGRDEDRDRNRDRVHDNRDSRDRITDRDVDRDRDRNKDCNFPRRDLKRDAPLTQGTGTNPNDPFRNMTSNTFSQNQQLFSAALKIDENRLSQGLRTNIDDLLNMPGRAKRPQRIVIILRGPPGSGKTFLAKQIKDKETENGGSAPRILSLDDYFMVEQEKEIIEDGKTIKVKDMVYEFEECMEESYRQSLLKTFKKTITDGYFPFIIVDNVNDKVKYFDGMWSFAKQNGFQVYICQLDLDVQICTKRNTHGRSEVEIQHIVSSWEEVPSHYGILDATNLIQAGSIAEVEMEEIDSPNEDFGDEDDDEEQACNSSKWDNFECSINNLAKLDGINKPLRSARTMEDYLQLDEFISKRSSTKPGQKRVRWADLEERKEQDKMRAIGFVVGQTDWGRMMDPTQGGSALTQTKYIERVGVRKLNMN